MAATTGQLGLVTPTQGTLTGTWGDTVNNGITEYTNIAIAGTLTLTGDGAVTLANTTGDNSASNITSTLTGAGTVTAQFAIVRVTGTLTTAKVVTGPAYSKTYTVVNAATGGIVTFKASGQTGVSIAVGESAFVYYNGTDYVKLASTTSGAAGGSTTQVQYNSSGALAGSANMTFDGTSLTLANGASIQGLTVGRGAGAVASNTAVGASALAANSTGVQHTVVGASAGASITTNAYLSAVGYQAAYYMTDSNDAFGRQALFGQSGATGYYNVGVGFRSGYSMTSGNFNTAIGNQALNSNTTASNNTAVGYQAAYTNTTGPKITAIGYVAAKLLNNGGPNFGDTMVGYAAGSSATTGIDNTFIGGQAGQAVTTGSTNTAVGSAALYLNTTASNNTAVGYQAGYTNTAGQYNTYIGMRSGYLSTDNLNTFVGYQSGYSTTGNGNTFIGAPGPGPYGSGYLVTTGSKNTILGAYNGNQGGLDIRTSSNYIVLSDGDGNPRGIFDGSGNFLLGTRTVTSPASPLGVTFVADGQNGRDIMRTACNSTAGTALIDFINANGYVGSISVSGSATTYATSSDYRLKHNISPMTGALAKVALLKPCTYKWNADGSDGEGFIAHELAEVVPQCVTGEKDAVDEEGNPKYQGIDTSFLVATLTAAIQELKAEFDAYKASHP